MTTKASQKDAPERKKTSSRIRCAVCLVLMVPAILYAASGLYRLHKAIVERDNTVTETTTEKREKRPTPQAVKGTWFFLQPTGPGRFLIVDFKAFEKGNFHREPSDTESRLIESVLDSLPARSDDLALLSICYRNDERPVLAIFTLSEKLQELPTEGRRRELTAFFIEEDWQESSDEPASQRDLFPSKMRWTNRKNQSVIQASLIGESPHQLLLLEYDN